MADTYDYEGNVVRAAGPSNETAVRAIAQHLHYNESLHLHERIEDKKPCPYCWLRAGKAIQAIRAAGLSITATEPRDTEITPVVAAHVLFHYGAGGYAAGSFTRQLIATIAAADPGNRSLLALSFPGYAFAVNDIERTPSGLDRLTEIAAQEVSQ